MPIGYSLIGFKGFLVLDGFGTINHTRTTGPVVFHPSLQRYKGCCNTLKLDRSTKDHTLTTGPVVLIHRSGAMKVVKGISKSNSQKLDSVQRPLGSARFWNNQPHAYNGSSCIPPSLQRYEGCRKKYRFD